MPSNANIFCIYYLKECANSYAEIISPSIRLKHTLEYEVFAFLMYVCIIYNYCISMLNRITQRVSLTCSTYLYTSYQGCTQFFLDLDALPNKNTITLTIIYVESVTSNIYSPITDHTTHIAI